MKPIYTHRGFVLDRAALGIPPSIEWYANASVEQLYAELQHTQSPYNSWEWRAHALKVIQGLFNLSPNFFYSQLYSDTPVSPRCLDFLYSTLNFIQTGQRRVSIWNWLELLAFHPQGLEVSNKTRSDFRNEFGQLYLLPTSKLIALWLQQPMGLQDLILTAHVIFAPLPEHFDKTTPM